MYLSGPTFSIILTILAGIALRYALWYGKDERPVQDAGAEDLRERTRALQDVVEQERAERLRLEADVARRGEDYESLRVAFDQADAERGQLRRERKQFAQKESDWSLRESEWQQRETEIEQERNHRESEWQQRESEWQQRESEWQQRETEFEQERNRRDAEWQQRETEWTAHQGSASEMEELVSSLQAESRTQLNQIAGLHDQLRALESQRDMLYTEIESTRSDAANLCDERQQVSAALETSAQTRAELEKRLKAAIQEVAEMNELQRQSEEKIALLEADSRFATDLRKEQSYLKTSLQESANRLQSLHAENASLSDQSTRAEERAEISERRVAELQAVVNDQSIKLGEQVERTTRYAEQLQQLGAKADQTISELHETYRQQLDALREDQTEGARHLGSQFEEEMESIRAGHAEEIQSMRLTHDQEIVQWRTREQALTNKLIELERNLEGIQSETTNFESESNQLRAERDAFANEVAQSRQSVTQLQSQLEAQSESLRLLNAEKDEVVYGLLREREQRNELEMTAAEATKAASENATAISELQRLREDYSRLENRFGDTQSELRRIDEENRQMKSTTQQEERRIEDLVRRLEIERDNLSSNLERERQERESAERTVRIHADTLSQLRQDSESMESLLQRQTMVQTSLKEHADRLQDTVRQSPIHDDVQILAFPADEGSGASSESDRERFDSRAA